MDKNKSLYIHNPKFVEERVNCRHIKKAKFSGLVQPGSVVTPVKKTAGHKYNLIHTYVLVYALQWSTQNSLMDVSTISNA